MPSGSLCRSCTHNFHDKTCGWSVVGFPYVYIRCLNYESKDNNLVDKEDTKMKRAERKKRKDPPPAEHWFVKSQDKLRDIYLAYLPNPKGK